MIKELVKKIYHFKQEELRFKELRTEAEAELARVTGVPDDWEGSRVNEVGDFKVRAIRKMNVKIDGNRLKELATANGLTSYLDKCFRWKPELNKAEWGKADDGVRTKLAGAIEMSPGKVSFSVTYKNETEISE